MNAFALGLLKEVASCWAQSLTVKLPTDGMAGAAAETVLEGVDVVVVVRGGR